jgi:hypothetical protein
LVELSNKRLKTLQKRQQFSNENESIKKALKAAELHRFNALLPASD